MKVKEEKDEFIRNMNIKNATKTVPTKQENIDELNNDIFTPLNTNISKLSNSTLPRSNLFTPSNRNNRHGKSSSTSSKTNSSSSGIDSSNFKDDIHDVEIMESESDNESTEYKSYVEWLLKREKLYPLEKPKPSISFILFTPFSPAALVVVSFLFFTFASRLLSTPNVRPPNFP